MLKRLTLVGFKSFADKTTFDFGPGITAVVGPNGSGKSNIVDAVRWILGEQSAKSLRGGEMADVIFNGSTSRRSLGLAEVSLVLDNGQRQLPYDADEVEITRRVYRDGEGEYLINKQPSRLRDIKELFLGSGAGGDAYCIIEQGRVDVLLQASPHERRFILEEAAGISRFRARKLETLRKLERVEQNLVRLKDIIEEVERQLRSVKLQASKAQRFREHSERLKELRVALSLDWCHRYSRQLEEASEAVERLRGQLDQRAADAQRWQDELQALERTLAELETSLRQEEGAAAAARQRIAAEQVTLEHEHAQTRDMELDLSESRQRLIQVRRDVAAITAQHERGTAERRAVEADCIAHRGVLSELEAKQAEANDHLQALRAQLQTDKDGLMEQMRQAARLHNEAVSRKAQAGTLAQHRDRLRNRTDATSHSLEQVDGEVRDLQVAEEQLQALLVTARGTYADLKRRRDETRQLVERTVQQLGELREHRSGLASRVEVLESLEASHEGLNTGVREVLTLVQGAATGPWRTVVGMVADMLTVRREYAPLIDLALGERAQSFLVRDAAQLAEAITLAATPFSGRVTFLPPSRAPLLEVETVPLPSFPGLIASAASLVECQHAEFADLPARLLGTTLVVNTLQTAHALAARLPGRRFVTLHGELLEPDGTLTVGAHHAEFGVLSRKSELRELREQTARVDRELAAAESRADELRGHVSKLDALDTEAQQELQVLTEQAADLRSRLQQQREKHEALARELNLGQREIQQLEADLEQLQREHVEAEAAAAEADRAVQRLYDRIDAAETGIRNAESAREQSQQALTAARVALATAEERFSAVQARHAQTEREWQQRQEELARLQTHIHGVEERLAACRMNLLRASSVLAQAFVDKETSERKIVELQAREQALRQERSDQAEQLQAAQSEHGALQAQAHQRDLEAAELRHLLQGVAVRLREDHDLDLLELYQTYTPPEQPIDEQAMQAESDELRRKIHRLGSVNLDSLTELAELETRARTLQTQHDDLVVAKKSLDEIITKINQDSRKAFTETYEKVRGHFQELFRKLFGGGMADILLEEGADALESGVEIVARPPGKELRSISLMSGGEKTLTAVALLLAIFRSKPSPFCILDEVDAALDEANIGRFTAVVREFTDRSQFIIITHSKKTMAVVDVLYGVTMQESGVSKKVAVRFEDWKEDEPEAAESAA
jgi:chromosome segregation protein